MVFFLDTILNEVDFVAVSESTDKEPIFVAWKDFISCNFIKCDIIPGDKDSKPYYFVSKIEDINKEKALEYFKEKSKPISDLKKYMKILNLIYEEVAMIYRAEPNTLMIFNADNGITAAVSGNELYSLK